MKPRRVLYAQFSDDEKKVIDCIKTSKFMHVSEIANKTGLSKQEVLTHLDTYRISSKYEKREAARLNAYEARELANLATIEPLYIDIKEAAERGKTEVEVTYLTEGEFNQLINDGYKIYAEYGTEQLTKWFDEIEGYDSILIDWEV